MFESLDFDPQVEKLNNIEKEKLRADVFGLEYNVNFDYSKIFLDIEKSIKSEGNTIGTNQLTEENKKIVLNIIKRVKDNKYKLTINFLESLNPKEKYLIAKLFIESTLKKKFDIRDSLLLWMIYWYNYDYKENLIDHEGIFKRLSSVVLKNFNFFYFKQAYFFLITNDDISILQKSENLDEKLWINKENFKLKHPDKFLFSVISEYNIINNLDGDVNSINKDMSFKLGKDYSLKVFHAEDKYGIGNEIKYGTYGLDKHGNQIENTAILKPMVDQNGNDISGAYVLKRDDNNLYENHDQRIYKDLSGIEYLEYLDSPSGIALFYGKDPVACMCFYIRNGKELFINQIQKVVHYEYDRYGRCIGRHYSSAINNIDWMEVIYDAIKIIAKKHNISCIFIQGGKNNKRTKLFRDDFSCTPYYEDNFLERDSYLNRNIHSKKVHLSLKIAELIYDNFALRNGFRRDQYGNYYYFLDKNG